MSRKAGFRGAFRLGGIFTPEARAQVQDALRAGGSIARAFVQRARAAFGQSKQETEAGPGTLWLSLSDVRWDAVAFGPEASPDGERFGEDCAFLSEGAAPTPELLVRRALSAIPERLRTHIGRVILATADSSLELLDNRALRLPDTDEAIRDIAAQQFGGTPASFGFVSYGQSSEREKERRLYAFTPVERLRSHLYGLDKLAVSMTCLTPLPALALTHLGAGATEPYAVLFLGGHFAHLMIANPESGAVAVRTIPVGALTLAAALAADTGLPLRDLAASLAGRDRLSALTPGKVEADIAAQTTIGAVLTVPLTQLREEIEETLGYFSYQRLSGSPEQLILCGEVNRVLGFDTWLAGATGLPVEVERRPWLDILLPSNEPRINLLDGAPDDLLTLGKTAYRFTNGRFVPEESDALPNVATLGTKPGARSDEGQKSSTPSSRLPWLQDQETRYFAAFAFVLLAALYLDVKSSVGPAGQALQGTVATYQNLLDENRSLEARRLVQAQAEAAADQPATLDPGSWAERLVAIARRIGPSVWLTRLAIEQPSGPTSKGAQRELSIQGRLPAGGDYLATIAAFVDGLNADEDFMRGLASLAFEGAKVSQTESATHVDFGLTAVYGTNPHPKGK